MRFTLGFAAAAGGLAFLLGATPAPAVQISISCGAVGKALELCKDGAEAWAKQSGNTVQVISTPNSTTERRISQRPD